MLSRMGVGTVISVPAVHKLSILLLAAASVSLTKDKRVSHNINQSIISDIEGVHLCTCTKGTKCWRCTCLHVMKAPPIKMTNVATTSRMIAGGERRFNIKITSLSSRPGVAYMTVH